MRCICNQTAGGTTTPFESEGTSEADIVVRKWV
jgi:hypothetical protein